MSKGNWTFPCADGIKSVIDRVKSVVETVMSQTDRVKSVVQTVISTTETVSSVTDRRLSEADTVMSVTDTVMSVVETVMSVTHRVMSVREKVISGGLLRPFAGDITLSAPFFAAGKAPKNRFLNPSARATTCPSNSCHFKRL